MRFISLILHLVNVSLGLSAQIPLFHDDPHNRAVSPRLYTELEELARIVDIAYCVGFTNTGISKPFACLSRCSEFPTFELVKTWNTGPLMSDSCGYIALDHSTEHPRILVAFRGTYSIANAVVDLSTIPQEYAPYPGGSGEASSRKQSWPFSIKTGGTPKCDNCTVHAGFYASWRVTADAIMPELEALLLAYPAYKVNLVGHSLGGAVATLAGLDFLAKGWHPTVTTYGEPRLGNKALMKYIDAVFNLDQQPLASHMSPQSIHSYEDSLALRRVTHIDDPVPQLPLSEWGFRMHAGEIFISKKDLSPDIQDMQHCFGDEDPLCIAGQDGSLAESTVASVVKDAGLWTSAGGGLSLPSRYKLWQMLFAHRDYFWRLGLCVPVGNPWDWGRQPESTIAEGIDRELKAKDK